MGVIMGWSEGPPLALASRANLGGLITAQEFGTSTHGPAEIAGRFQSMIDQARTGEVIEFDPRATYDFGARITVPGEKRLTLRFNGARIRAVGDNGLLKVTTNVPQWVSVTDPRVESRILTVDDGTPTTVAVFEVAGIPTGLEPGARVLIAAEDRIPGTHTSSGGTKWMRLAQNMTVARVSGNTIILSAVPEHWSAYQTQIRLLVRPVSTVEITDLDCLVSPIGVAGGWNDTLLRIDGCTDALIRKVKGTDVLGKFLEIAGCDRPRIEDVTVDGAANEPANNRYGYGLSLLGNTSGAVISGLHTRQCRHGFTTDTPESALAVPAWEQGSVTHGVLANSTGEACTSSFIDFHTGARRMLVASCNTMGNYRGPDGAGAGYQVRGRFITLSDCLSDGDTIGFHITDQGSAGATNTVTLNNCQAVSQDRALLVNSASGSTMTGIEAHGCRFDSEGYALLGSEPSKTVQTIDADLVMTGGSIAGGPNSATWGSAVSMSGTTGKFVAAGTRFDIQDMPGRASLVKLGHANHEARLINCPAKMRVDQYLVRGPSSPGGIAFVANLMPELIGTLTNAFDANVQTGRWTVFNHTSPTGWDTGTA